MRVLTPRRRGEKWGHRAKCCTASIRIQPRFCGVILAHVIALNPTQRQAAAFRRYAGTARYVYNWALAESESDYRAGRKVDLNALKRRWNLEKPDWAREAPRDANSQPFADLRVARANFFRRIREGRPGPKGAPRFKRKGVHDGFYVANDKFRFDGRSVRLPKVGWVRCREALRFGGKILSGRVKLVAGRWYLSVQVEVADGQVARQRNATRRSVVGVDVGLTTLATLSTGEKIEGPKPLKSTLKKLRRASRSHSRKQKGSNRRKRSAERLARLHRRIRNVRVDALHKLTTKICRENQAVVIEDLDASAMGRSLRLGRSVADASLREVRRQLEYKAPLHGCRLLVADRWFPSSKSCSSCGEVNPTVTLGVSHWVCPGCGKMHDRDENAAKNLEAYAAGGCPDAKNGRGEEGSGRERLGETVLNETSTGCTDSLVRLRQQGRTDG
ncbi:RNA-guided endonuclease InsQ/TnpB family protein [Alienimonas sp. DA493]|uniref:RNA-guided endonuclease InsQ/TnpB family protein n=1 Tax=Alienimonas sp. DA493 TaxID=3373605 RepID=UPI0037540A08